MVKPVKTKRGQATEGIQEQGWDGEVGTEGGQFVAGWTFLVLRSKGF